MPRRCAGVVVIQTAQTQTAGCLIDSFKITPIIVGIACASGLKRETDMDGTAARHEAEKILAELPDRISDVIKPFARQSPDQPALVQGNVTGRTRNWLPSSQTPCPS